MHHDSVAQPSDAAARSTPSPLPVARPKINPAVVAAIRADALRSPAEYVQATEVPHGGE